jgi:lipopolysaccharide transport system ATP-binding protein
MPDPAIRAVGLSKRYRIGSRSRWQPGRFSRLFHRAAPRDGGDEEQLWALRDVSFEVSRGEILGLIGANGAGKSTLLKILSRITEPTDGFAEIRGRMASLLEVGTGFHGELTGRENIYLNGAILGMKRLEIERRFDEIVDFAEVARFVDTPVKHYSSGMYARLAFAVAAHVEPEILVVDEVLSVGDAAFQRKCLGRMGDFGRGGRTVIFVSHNLQAVQTLCDRVLLLEQGRTDRLGPPGDVVATYLSRSSRQVLAAEWEPSSSPGNERVRLLRAKVLPHAGWPGDYITVRTPMELEFVVELLPTETNFSAGIHLRNVYGEIVFVSSCAPRAVGRGRHRVTCSIPGDLLNNGTFAIDLYLVKDATLVLHRHADVLVFDVHDVAREAWLGELPGAVRPRLAWSLEPVHVGGAKPHEVGEVR